MDRTAAACRTRPPSPATLPACTNDGYGDRRRSPVPRARCGLAGTAEEAGSSSPRRAGHGRTGRPGARRRDPALRADGARDGGERSHETSEPGGRPADQAGRLRRSSRSLPTGALAQTIGNFRFGGTTTYRARFTDVDRPAQGRRRAHRRGAGRRGRRRRGGRRATARSASVTFTVDVDRPLAVSTRAQIRYRNLVGQRYVALTEGPARARCSRRTAPIPLRADPAGARPDGAVQRLQAAVRRAEPRGRQRASRSRSSRRSRARAAT